MFRVQGSGFPFLLQGSNVQRSPFRAPIYYLTDGLKFLNPQEPFPFAVRLFFNSSTHQLPTLNLLPMNPEPIRPEPRTSEPGTSEPSPIQPAKYLPEIRKRFFDTIFIPDKHPGGDKPCNGKTHGDSVISVGFNFSPSGGAARHD